MRRIQTYRFKFLLIVYFGLLAGCGEDPMNINPYPVASQYTNESLEDFQDALVMYYAVTDSGIFKVCQLTPGFCDDYYQLEDWVRAY